MTQRKLDDTYDSLRAAEGLVSDIEDRAVRAETELGTLQKELEASVLLANTVSVRAEDAEQSVPRASLLACWTDRYETCQRARSNRILE